MKFELSIGKVSYGFEKGDRKESTSMESVNMSLEAEPEEAIGAIKVMVDAIKEQCKQAVGQINEASEDEVEIVMENVEVTTDESKNGYDIPLLMTLEVVKKTGQRYEIKASADGIDYTIYTKHKDVLLDAAESKLDMDKLDAFVEDATIFRTFLSNVRRLSEDQIRGFVLMTNDSRSTVKVIK